MKKFSSYLLKYIIFSFPIFLGYALWGSFYPQTEVHTGVRWFFEELFGWNIILWFLASFLLLLLLVLSKEVREKILPPLSRISEKDEREAFLIGKSARNTYLFSLAGIFLLFFLSSFQLSLKELGPDEHYDKKTQSLSLELKMNLLQKGTKNPSQTELKFPGLPLSNQGLLLALLALQLGSFTYFSRSRFDLSQEA